MKTQPPSHSIPASRGTEKMVLVSADLRDLHAAVTAVSSQNYVRYFVRNLFSLALAADRSLQLCRMRRGAWPLAHQETAAKTKRMFTKDPGILLPSTRPTCEVSRGGLGWLTIQPVQRTLDIHSFKSLSISRPGTRDPEPRLSVVSS